jgi:hypothetical protein
MERLDDLRRRAATPLTLGPDEGMIVDGTTVGI